MKKIEAPYSHDNRRNKIHIVGDADITLCGHAAEPSWKPTDAKHTCRVCEMVRQARGIKEDA